MVYEARILGASAVLLIASLLGDALGRYLSLAHSLGLAALVEIHDEAEAALAVSSGAGIVGVNNRDLRTFAVDTALSVRLRGSIPDGILFVAESGIKTPEDVRIMKEIGADAVLVGESFMRAEDKAAMLLALRG
jgi:indole-3-glycerol phosphate synthase